MIIHVGSANEAKLRAVRAAFSHYFTDITIKGIAVQSIVACQPQGIKEIMKGAKHRATAAFSGADYSVGIESGIFPFPGTHSGFMDMTCCAIYDGRRHYLGTAPLFEHPTHVVDAVLKENKEISQVFHELGYGNERLRHEEGAIGFLTKGKATREKITELGILMALAQIVNRECYFPPAPQQSGGTPSAPLP